MPPLLFENGLPDVPDEDYQRWSNDQWLQQAQDDLARPLQEMPPPQPVAPTPAPAPEPTPQSSSSQGDDGFMARAQSDLNAGLAKIAASNPTPQPSPSSGQDNTRPAPQPEPQPTSPLSWNGSYWQDPNFGSNIQRYGARIAQQLGPSIANFAMAQARLETANGQEMSTPYNYGNVGNTDENPRGGGRYTSPEQAADAWVGFITNNGNNAPGANRYYNFTQAGQNGADVGTLAQLIKQAGYATDPNYASKIASLAGSPLPADTPASPMAMPLPTPGSPRDNNQQQGSGLLNALGGAKDWLGHAKDQLAAGLQGLTSNAGDWLYNNAGPGATQQLRDASGTQPMSLDDALRQGQQLVDQSNDRADQEMRQAGLNPDNPLDRGEYMGDRTADILSQATVHQDFDQTGLGQSWAAPIIKQTLDPASWVAFGLGGSVGALAGNGGVLFPAVGRAVANGIISANDYARQGGDPIEGFLIGTAFGAGMEAAGHFVPQLIQAGVTKAPDAFRSVIGAILRNSPEVSAAAESSGIELPRSGFTARQDEVFQRLSNGQQVDPAEIQAAFSMGGGSGDMLGPGEALDVRRPQDTPNYATLSQYAAQDHRIRYDLGGLDAKGNTSGAGFEIPKPTKAEVANNVIRPFIQDLRPNMLIPYNQARAFDPNATSFTQAAGANRANIASGAYQPEAALIGHFATIGSIQRGAAPYTRLLDAVGDEAALRQQPDLNLQNTVSRNDIKGVTTRPEIAAAHIVGDTTNPDMMSMLYAIAHPNSFGDAATRAEVIKNGTLELFRAMRTAGHGSRTDVQTILGLPVKRVNGSFSPNGPAWMDTFPQLWQKTIDWAQGNQSFNEGLLHSYIGEGRMAGEGNVKGRFAAAMSGVSPEPATLDARMMTDVYGLRGDMGARLTNAEYEYLTRQVQEATGASSGYEGQWATWSYVGGSKTSYQSLLDLQQKVSDFFTRVQQVAQQTGQRPEDVIPQLTAQEPKVNVGYGDQSLVRTQIGLASDRIQGLPVGSTWGKIQKQVPQLKALADQAGINVINGIKTGVGYWVDEKDGVAWPEKNFNLVVEGPKSAVEWFAAAMGRMEPAGENESQSAVLVTHHGTGGSTPAVKLQVTGLTPENADAIAKVLGKYVQGFDMGWENTRKGQATIHMVGLGSDPQEFQKIVNHAAGALADAGVAIKGGTEVQLTDARLIDRSEYDSIIRGGPRGARALSEGEAQPAGNAGGGGSGSPTGGARETGGESAAAPLGDNNGNPLVQAPGENGLTQLHAGFRVPGRSLGGALVGAAAGNISTPSDATAEERKQRILSGAAAGAIGGYFGPQLRDMLAPRLGRSTLRALGKETTTDLAGRLGDVAYRWNRVLAPLKNLPDEQRGVFVDLGNRLLQDKQIGLSHELEGESLFGRTGSPTNGLGQSMEFEETGGLRNTTPEQEAYLERMRNFGRASNSIGQAKGFIFGDVTEPGPVRSAAKNPGEFSDKTKGGPPPAPGKWAPMQNAGPEMLRPSNYFPHLYESVKSDAMRQARRLNMSPLNFFSYQRQAPTLREANTLGWRPVNAFTQTWSQYVRGWLDSEAKADALAQLKEMGAITELKPDAQTGRAAAPDGKVYLGDIDKAFRGYAGSPEIAQALKALSQPSWFRSDAPGAPVIATLMNIGGEAKKQLLTLSGFHLKNLLQQSYRAVSSPKDAAQMVGTSLYHLVSPKAYSVYRMAVAPLFEDAAGHGVTFPGTAGPDVEGTVAGELKRRAVGAGMGTVFGYGKGKAQGQDDLDALKQGLAYGAAGGLLSGKFTDEYAKGLWDRVVPTLKLETYRVLSAGKDDLAKGQVADFVNNLYGGQNLAKIGRSQTVQDMLRLGFLAPDWWEGWGRLVGNSLPDTTLGGMSRAFWLRTLAIDGAFTLEALNYAFNGHFTNDNEEGRQFELELTGLYDKLGIQHQGRQYLDILGPIQPILKLATTGNIGRFYESRTSLPGSTIMQLHENKDYSSGEPIVEPGSTALQALPQMASSVVGRVAPVGLQQADTARTSGRAIPGEVASMVTGMRQYQGPDKGALLDRRDT
ncbi:MAG: glucosaminidase domain-containing protein, partial [Chloroflexota bacterium]|nr:glucosaminidase domain-containing protein [Chloroflexota bacterium]